MNILVTGGAGYIGSITADYLVKKGHSVVIFDRNYVKEPMDLLNKTDLETIFKSNKFDGVIHFAANALAGESMKNPAKYFENNIIGGLNLLEAMRKHNINNIVFSSTCAIYGYPKTLPVSEKSSFAPVSVYGESKLMFEKVLDWYDSIFNIKHIALRYFNAAGASIDGTLGENHDPETHIIPLCINVILGKAKKFTIFGDDYNTQDGTCVRDYIHVLDLAQAHLQALEYLQKQGESNEFNLGTGQGYSNKEIIDMVKQVTGVNFDVEIGPRRPGDPDEIYADNTKAKKVLGWKPEYSDLKTIVETSWKYHNK